MLEADIKDLIAAGVSADHDQRAVFAQLREALSSGQVRAARPTPRARSAGASTSG
jgi:hypothetical protein